MSNYDDDFNVQIDHEIDEQRAQKTRASTTGSDSAYQPPKEDDDLNIHASNFDLKNAGHPSACIATFAFKAAAFFMYRPLHAGISSAGSCPPSSSSSSSLC